MVTFSKEQDLRATDLHFAIRAFQDLAIALDDKYRGIGPEGYCAEKPEMTPVDAALKFAAKCLADLLAHDQRAE